jgi:hypothetical protein
MLRQAFNLWERTTGAYLEALTRNPFFLTASGGGLGGLLHLKRIADTAIESLVSSMGLATRSDQERTLHLLHRIEGRLEDLRLELAERSAR